MEDSKCAYLGCEHKGVILDESDQFAKIVIETVEIAPGVLENLFVCEEHLGQLVGNIEMKANSQCILSRESD